MSRPNSLVTGVAVLLGVAVAAFASLDLVVGQHYTMTGPMTQCHEHVGTFFINDPSVGGGGSASSREAGSDHGHGAMLMLKAGSAAVNLSAVFQSLQPGQKITATGEYLGLVDSGHGEKHATLKVCHVTANPTKQQTNFQSIYDLRRQ